MKAFQHPRTFELTISIKLWSLRELVCSLLLAQFRTQSSSILGTARHFSICSFQYRIHVERREAPEAAREETASLPHGWPFYLVSTDHCRNTAGDRAKLALIIMTVSWLSSFVSLKKFCRSLNHHHLQHMSYFKTPVLRYGIT